MRVRLLIGLFVGGLFFTPAAYAGRATGIPRMFQMLVSPEMWQNYPMGMLGVLAVLGGIIYVTVKNI